MVPNWFYILLALAGIAATIAYRYGWRPHFPVFVRRPGTTGTASTRTMPTLTIPPWITLKLFGWVLVAAALLAAAGYFLANFRTFTWSASPSNSGNPLGNDAGLPDLTIDTPASTTPWWQDYYTNLESFMATWGPQMGMAAVIAFLVVVFLYALFKGMRETSRWWLLLLFVVLAVVFFFFGPQIVVLIKETPDWVATTWRYASPIAGRVVLSVVLIAIMLACLLGIPKLTTWGERFSALGAILLVAYIGWVAIWNVDWSRHGYAEHSAPGAPPRQEWGLAVAPTSPCDSREVVYTFQASKPAMPTNEAGQCSLVLWHKNHCVYTLSYKESVPEKACDFGNGLVGRYAVDAEYVWSADSAFTDKYRPDPPRTN